MGLKSAGEAQGAKAEGGGAHARVPAYLSTWLHTAIIFINLFTPAFPNLFTLAFLNFFTLAVQADKQRRMMGLESAGAAEGEAVEGEEAAVDFTPRTQAVRLPSLENRKSHPSNPRANPPPPTPEQIPPP